TGIPDTAFAALENTVAIAEPKNPAQPSYYWSSELTRQAKPRAPIGGNSVAELGGTTACTSPKVKLSKYVTLMSQGFWGIPLRTHEVIMLASPEWFRFPRPMCVRFPETSM